MVSLFFKPVIDDDSMDVGAQSCIGTSSEPNGVVTKNQVRRHYLSQCLGVFDGRAMLDISFCTSFAPSGWES